MKPKLSLEQEKEIYEDQWREVYNECFYKGIINKEKIVSIMHKLNMVDIKIIKEKENGSSN